ncbi:hypothetical protein ACFFX0_05760 [Citricoccus parietis]|uniref:Uncharacterized protein n=1 Tax=Citricoccus parietis TaxID=592307 RepID=A0ABV5FVN1_9MICC
MVMKATRKTAEGRTDSSRPRHPPTVARTSISPFSVTAVPDPTLRKAASSWPRGSSRCGTPSAGGVAFGVSCGVGAPEVSGSWVMRRSCQQFVTGVEDRGEVIVLREETLDAQPATGLDAGDAALPDPYQPQPLAAGGHPAGTGSLGHQVHGETHRSGRSRQPYGGHQAHALHESPMGSSACGTARSRLREGRGGGRGGGGHGRCQRTSVTSGPRSGGRWRGSTMVGASDRPVDCGAPAGPEDPVSADSPD